jgi:poly-gamma-glutamate synthesis protein (capsule biosynthesis protein)
VRSFGLALLLGLPALMVTATVPSRTTPAVRDHAAAREVIGIPSPPAAPQPATQPAPHSITVALTGDVLVHNTVWQSARREAERESGTRAFDFRPMLAPIRPIIRGADLAIGHLEVPVAPVGGPYSSYPRFAAPREVVTALRWAGYDACSTGSNHSIDEGNAGLVRTLDVLDAAGLRHTGTYRSADEAATPVVLDVTGFRVAWFEYTWGTNGLVVDADRRWSVDLIDPDRILRDAHRARQQGADAVLVGLHWGAEYRSAPTGEQTKLARRLAGSPDITLVYGHHAHVVQPVRRIGRTWVVFGLGNLVADQRDTAPGVDRGLIALVTLTLRGERSALVTRVVTVPTRIDTSGEIRVRPAGAPQVLRTGTS